jgi:hypothetical protein
VPSYAATVVPTSGAAVIGDYVGVASGFALISSVAFVSSSTINGNVALQAFTVNNNNVMTGNLFLDWITAQPYIDAANAGYNKVLAMTPTTTITAYSLGQGSISTLTPGVYKLNACSITGTGISIFGTLTLDCQNAATCEFFFQCAATDSSVYGPMFYVGSGTQIKYANVASGVTPLSIWAIQWAVYIGGSTSAPVNMVGTIITGTTLAGVASNIKITSATTGPIYNPAIGSGFAVQVGMDNHACTISTNNQ